MMLLAVGCNFRDTPIALRERLAFDDNKLLLALDQPKGALPTAVGIADGVPQSSGGEVEVDVSARRRVANHDHALADVGYRTRAGPV